jgi:hypothetical protein
MLLSNIAAEVVAQALARRPPKERAEFLRELLTHTAAGLVVIDGNSSAAEAVYRLADAIVDGATKDDHYEAKK